MDAPTEPAAGRSQLRSHLGGAVFATHATAPAGAPAGPTVVALHGWGRDRSDLAAVVAGRTSVSVDLPGFGASPPPPEAWGSADYARAVAAVLEGSGVAGAVVVGHSFGGRVAAHLAATRPDLVAGVVFAGVPLVRLSPPGRPPWWYRAVRRAHRIGLVPEGAMERLRRRRGSADYNAATGVLRGVLVRVVGETYEDQLAAIAAPVALCWGEADADVPPEVARRAAALVPRCVAVDVVPGAGHDVHRQAPDRVRAAVAAVEAAR